MTEAELTELRDWQAFYRQVKAKYKITDQEYVALYVAQGGVCFICRIAKGRDPRAPLAWAGRKAKPRRLGVDHNHLTGIVRGLLCSGSLNANTCNRLIARYSPEQLLRAHNYCVDPPAPRVLDRLRVG